MAKRSSRGEAEILSRLDSLDPHSDRYHVLKAARAFKASWVDLGEHLTKVRESGLYKGWGYTSFDVYCRRELHIRKDTADKLTRSFSFLREHKPAALTGQERENLPALDVVDVLSRAREKAEIPQEQLATIGQELLSTDNSASRTEVLRRLREIDPQALRHAPKIIDEGALGSELRKALLLAERLESLLVAQQSHVTPNAIEGVRRAVCELREQVSTARQQGAAGAA